MFNCDNKILNIKGGWNYCEIFFENGDNLKCYGELMKDGFCIYRSSLKVTDSEVEILKKLLVESNPDGKKVNVYIG